jgi:hypothetical protein
MGGARPPSLAGQPPIFFFSFRVKYVFAPCDLTHLFFAPYDSFRIVDCTLVLVKDGDSTSIQKLIVAHISATKHLLKVDTCHRCHISVMLYFYFLFFLKALKI